MPNYLRYNKLHLNELESTIVFLLLMGINN